MAEEIEQAAEESLKQKKHKKDFQGLPFQPLAKVDTDAPIQEESLAELFKRRPEGVSICVRSGSGHVNRGGYFFHLAQGADKPELVTIFNFEGIPVTALDLKRVTAFVNHCSGLSFDQEIFELCQSVINFRLDPEKEPEQQQQQELRGPGAGV